jgi:hypothetical protein
MAAFQKDIEAFERRGTQVLAGYFFGTLSLQGMFLWT